MLKKMSLKSTTILREVLRYAPFINKKAYAISGSANCFYTRARSIAFASGIKIRESSPRTPTLKV